MWRPPWYQKLEEKLQPAQGVVIAGLIAVAAISIYMIFQKSRSLRTAWFVYLISP